MSSSESVWDELDVADDDEEEEEEEDEEEEDEDEDDDDGFSWLGMEADPMAVVTAKDKEFYMKNLKTRIVHWENPFSV